MKRILTALAALTLLPACFAAQNNSQQYFEKTLANGLQVVVKPDHRTPVVDASIWYKVGGSYEHNGITGISHLLEHMLFLGTKKYAKGVSDKLISKNGGSGNAATSTDYTNYYIYLPSSKLDLAFDIESDRMKNVVFNNKDFLNERNVVAEERRMRIDDVPQQVAYERFVAAAFVNNPYHHPTVGWMTDIMHLTLKNADGWYKTFYSPNNAVLIVIGDVQPNKVFTMAKKYYGKIKAGKIPVMKPRTEIPSLGVKTIHLTMASAKLPWLLMGYYAPSINTLKNPKDAYALMLAANILGGGDSSRIAKDLVRGRKIATEASASYSLVSLHDGQFFLEGVPTKGSTMKILKKALLAEANKLKTEPVTEAELKKEQAGAISAYTFNQDSIEAQVDTIGTYLSTGLKIKDFENFVPNVEKVTAADIQAAAKKYFVKKNLTITILQPPKAKPNTDKTDGAK